MIFDLRTLKLVVRPLTQAEGARILERDHFRCQYCGLDGRTAFENALVMSVDFIFPRAHKGRKRPENLVACCRACNVIKGRRIFKNFEEAKAYVLERRDALRKVWESKLPASRAQSGTA